MTELIAPAENIIMPTARISVATGADLVGDGDGGDDRNPAKPMISRTAIGVMAAANDGRTQVELWPFSPSRRS